MHETGLALEIAKIATEEIDKSGSTGAVTSLHLKVGRWSGVETQTLRFALETVIDGTRLDGASIEIEVVEPTFHCVDCDEDFTAEEHFDPCPRCKGPGGPMIGGDEMLLTHIEVED